MRIALEGANGAHLRFLSSRLLLEQTELELWLPLGCHPATGWRLALEAAVYLLCAGLGCDRVHRLRLAAIAGAERSVCHVDAVVVAHLVTIVRRIGH